MRPMFVRMRGGRGCSTRSEASDSRVVDRATKAMLFIDGTWLYYSMLRGRDSRHGFRVCPVRRAYGDRWHAEYRVDWRQIPILVGQMLTKQLEERRHHKCFVDVSRTYAFTSTFANTTEDSIRSQMIRDWHKANYDVTHLETLGSTEKCVDISLAVEMLSLATVPDAYDIAVILTGDKDFIPAMAKTRLKGKNVALVSMRNSANAALYQPPAEKDFDVIWLEDHLDEIIRSKYPESFDKKLVELIRIEVAKNSGMLSSRDIGRILQSRQIEGHNALTTLKAKTPGLKYFLEQHDEDFRLDYDNDTLEPHDFMVTIVKTDNDGQDPLMQLDMTIDSGGSTSGVYYDGMTVIQLKNLLREKSLPVSGTKAELIARLQEGATARAIATITGSSLLTPGSGSPTSFAVEDEAVSKLIEIVRSQIVKVGGVITSNELGLLLQSKSFRKGENALQAMKRLYGSVRGFTSCHDTYFCIDDDYKGDGSVQVSSKTFGLRLVQDE